MRERDIEKYLKDQVESMGGLFFKFTSPGNAGVPDRLVILPGGKIYFIELKTEDGHVSRLQHYQISRIMERGASCWVLRGKKACEDWIAMRMMERDQEERAEYVRLLGEEDDYGV